MRKTFCYTLRMSIVTISSKHQIVIPKEIRRKLNMKPGQKLRVNENERGQVVIEPNSVVDEYFGMFAGKEIWGKDPVATIRKMRDEWDE